MLADWIAVGAVLVVIGLFGLGGFLHGRDARRG